MRLAHRLLLQSLAIVAVMVISVVIIIDNQLHSSITDQTIHDLAGGRAAAIANIFGLHVSGWPAWMIWLFVHLMYIVEFQSRILVFIQWGFQYLTFSRGARLITGTSATDSLDTADSISPRAAKSCTLATAGAV